MRFGGGMGNIVRGGQVSGLPRYLEGARYSAQWAGMPYPVYAGYKGQNDLSDDINVRSRTINYLSGGSVFNPKEPGLGVPLEMSSTAQRCGFQDRRPDCRYTRHLHYPFQRWQVSGRNRPLRLARPYRPVPHPSATGHPFHFQCRLDAPQHVEP